MKKNKFLSLVLAGLMILSTNISSFAECTSKEIKEKRIVGYNKHTDKNGKTHTTPIYKEVVVAVVTKCNDKVLVQFSVQSDVAGNVYVDGKKVGINGKVSKMDISSNITNRLGEIGLTVDDFSSAVLNGKVSVTDARDVITNEAQYQEASGFKTAKTQTFEDWTKNMVGGNNGVENLDTSNVKITTTGKVQGNISFDIPPGSGYDLGTMSRNKNPKKSLEELNGKAFDSTLKAIENIGSGKSVTQNMNFVSIAINIQRDYKNEKEIIPKEPPQDPKPKDFVSYGDAINCPNYLVWTEVEYEEKVTKTKYHTDTKGNAYYYDKKSYIPHQYQYRIDFKTDVKLTDAKGRDLKTMPIKSGYGIRVYTNTTYKVTGGNGRKAKHTPTIEIPKGAFVMHSWNMTHIYKTQPKTTILERNGNWGFKTPVNPLSKTKSDVIYTDRDMEDGSHKIYVEVTNIKVQGRSLCTKQSETFKIKGNMYEDIGIY